MKHYSTQRAPSSTRRQAVPASRVVEDVGPMSTSPRRAYQFANIGPSAPIQRTYQVNTAPGFGGVQVTTYTHQMPQNRTEFFNDHNNNRIQIRNDQATSFFTTKDRKKNNRRQDQQNDPIRVSSEWPFDYITPLSQPPGIVHHAPATTQHFIHAHSFVHSDTSVTVTHLHVKTHPGGGIAYALQTADANALGLVIKMPT